MCVCVRVCAGVCGCVWEWVRISWEALSTLSLSSLCVCLYLSLWIQLVLCHWCPLYVFVNSSPIFPMTVMWKRNVCVAFKPDVGRLSGCLSSPVRGGGSPLHWWDQECVCACLCVCACACLCCQLVFRQQQFAERELKVGRGAKWVPGDRYRGQREKKEEIKKDFSHTCSHLHKETYPTSSRFISPRSSTLKHV